MCGCVCLFFRVSACVVLLLCVSVRQEHRDRCDLKVVEEDSTPTLKSYNVGAVNAWVRIPKTTRTWLEVATQEREWEELEDIMKNTSVISIASSSRGCLTSNQVTKKRNNPKSQEDAARARKEAGGAARQLQQRRNRSLLSREKCHQKTEKTS